ncbi:MAG: serine/threonine protein kinase [Verrucomicrobiales bacterium]|nr:serine/threonine protein kinase [Verrucomicrobiales bacterium]
MSFPVPTHDAIQAALNLPDDPVHIATGGLKAVYRFDWPNGGPEAIKAVYIPPGRTDEEMLQREQLIARAKREIEALRACSHPAIVKLGHIQPELFTIGTHDYLIYGEEFLPGESLVAQLDTAKPAMTFADLKLIFETLLVLIDELAQLGFLHRDIKPDNIIDTGDSDRRYVVLDMGIAYKMEGTQLTQGGAPGTIRYMAPEMLMPDYKDHMDFRCDLYSAGLTVYVLASRQHPYAPRPEHQYATMWRIMNVQPEKLTTLRPDLPPEICRMIDRCIRKKPALRYSRIAQILNELKGIKQ